MTIATKTNNNNDNAGRKRATSYDVAELAGASQSAVSHVFQDGASTSKTMRDRVIENCGHLSSLEQPGIVT